MNMIVACDLTGGIGYDNQLLFHIKEDMKLFKELTYGKAVIMGRKTLESLPNSTPLQGRTNYVITHNKNYKVHGAIICESLEESIAKAHQTYNTDDVFIIGGESIYAQAEKHCKYVYLTLVHKSYKSNKHITISENWTPIDILRPPIIYDGANVNFIKYLIHRG